MLKNYLTIAFRNLLKYKLHSFINIFGLALGLASSIIIFLYANTELTFDKVHEKAENIYQVYKERCAAFLNSPPPEHWDGVYTLTRK